MNMQNEHTALGPIGIFDSGYGGLTILEQVRKGLPQYDYLYLGDNARAPYGTRSFEIVYEFTKQAVLHLFDEGCSLVILACNTASAKSLRSIQQNDLPRIAPDKRVLGVIRPTVEALSTLTHTGHIGILATPGTIQSRSYEMEIKKMYPSFEVYGQACPMWVPLVENNEAQGPGADYFVQKYIDELLAQSSAIDTVVLGCTHYPLLLDKAVSAPVGIGGGAGPAGYRPARRLSAPSPRDREPLLERGELPVSHYRVDGQIFRGGHPVPQRTGRGRTHCIGITIKNF